MLSLARFATRLSAIYLVLPRVKNSNPRYYNLQMSKFLTTTGIYSRSGVEAAARLASLFPNDRPLWDQIDAQYKGMIHKKGGDKLLALDDYCDSLALKLQSSPIVDKEEFLEIIQWKFTKGKPRYPLLALLKSNSNESIQKHSSAAFAMVQSLPPNVYDGDVVQKATKELCELKNVGPATASAILSLYRPDLFAFMDDQIIDLFCSLGRGYTLKIYTNINIRCVQLAKGLGEGWTSKRVGRALWTACMIPTFGGEDLTLSAAATDVVDSDEQEESGSKRKSNRRTANEKTDLKKKPAVPKRRKRS